jgi:hypothetical protein
MASWASFVDEYNNGINLAQPGSSFYRVVRTTMEFCANNRVDRVLVGLPFIDRYELPSDVADTKIEGPYVQSTRDHIRDTALELYIDLGNNSTYYALDRYFTALIGFAAWLEQQQIKYTIWDMSNNFGNIDMSEYQSLDKIKYIKENKNIIDLFTFCGNLYLEQQGAVGDTTEYNIPAQFKHYTSDSYSQILKPFIEQHGA